MKLLHLYILSCNDPFLSTAYNAQVFYPLEMVEVICSIFSFLTQFELLQSDSTCRAWKKVISAADFWAKLNLDLSHSQVRGHLIRTSFVYPLQQLACSGMIISQVLSQPRFSTCLMLDLSGHYFQLEDWQRVLNSMVSCMHHIEHLNLRRIKIYYPDRYQILCSLSEFYKDFCSRLRSLAYTHVKRYDYHFNPAPPKEFRNLVSLTLDGGRIANSPEDYDFMGVESLPSLIHLRIENNDVITVWGIVGLFKAFPALRTLTLMNCRNAWMGMYEADYAWMELVDACPTGLERIVLPNGQRASEFLDSFWIRVQRHRQRRRESNACPVLPSKP